jgi:hypothetical protein
MSFPCNICAKVFSTPGNLKRHTLNTHGDAQSKPVEISAGSAVLQPNPSDVINFAYQLLSEQRDVIGGIPLNSRGGGYYWAPQLFLCTSVD